MLLVQYWQFRRVSHRYLVFVWFLIGVSAVLVVSLLFTFYLGFVWLLIGVSAVLAVSSLFTSFWTDGAIVAHAIPHIQSVIITKVSTMIIMTNIGKCRLILVNIPHIQSVIITKVNTMLIMMILVICLWLLKFWCWKISNFCDARTI